jgi:hypothetical protein
MKLSIVCPVLAFVLTLGASVALANPIRSGLELSLVKGKDTWSAQSVISIGTAQSTNLELGDYLVSLEVKDGTDGGYILRVSVTDSLDKTKGKIVLNKDFVGNHKVPLEFSATERDLTLKGTIFVGELAKASQAN